MKPAPRTCFQQDNVTVVLMCLCVAFDTTSDQVEDLAALTLYVII